MDPPACSVSGSRSGWPPDPARSSVPCPTMGAGHFSCTAHLKGRAVAYDTAAQKVRLLISDIQTGDNQVLGDDEIDGFLALNDDNIRLAAADALRAIATSEALISKVIRTQDKSTDGAKLAEALLKLADKYEQQGRETADDDAGAFDIVPVRTIPPELTEHQAWYPYRAWGL